MVPAASKKGVQEDLLTEYYLDFLDSREFSYQKAASERSRVQLPEGGIRTLTSSAPEVSRSTAH